MVEEDFLDPEKEKNMFILETPTVDRRCWKTCYATYNSLDYIRSLGYYHRRCGISESFCVTWYIFSQYRSS